MHNAIGLSLLESSGKYFPVYTISISSKTFGEIN